MSIFTQSVCAIGFATIVAGCSQQEETIIRPEPVYNKYGAVVSAEEGGCARDGSCRPREQRIPEDDPEGGGDGDGGGNGDTAN